MRGATSRPRRMRSSHGARCRAVDAMRPRPVSWCHRAILISPQLAVCSNISSPDAAMRAGGGSSGATVMQRGVMGRRVPGPIASPCVARPSV